MASEYADIPEGFQVAGQQPYSDIPPGFQVVPPQPTTKSASVAQNGLKYLAGLGEMAMTMGSGLVAQPVAGIAGIGATLTKGPDAGADAVRYWQDQLTYQPRGEFAQQELGQMGAAMDRFYQQPLERVAGYATDVTGDPKVGAGIEVAAAALPMAAGVRGVKPKVPKVKAQPHADALARLRGRASALYKQAEDSGVIISGKSFDKFVSRLEAKLAAEGIDAKLHPNAVAVLKRLQDRRGKNFSFKGADIERRVIADAAGVKNSAEQRITGIMRDMYDDYINTLGGKDVLPGTGDPKAAATLLNEARSTWRTMKKAEIIEEAIELAGVNAGTYTGAGFENALRVAFRQLARKGVKNKRVRAQFTDAEWKMIRKVANGGPVQNVLQWLGKMSIRSPVGGGVGAGAGYAIGGPVGAVALPVAAEGAKRGAAAMGIRNANRLFEDIAGP